MTAILKAVGESDLSPLDRLVIVTLAGRSNPASGVIPDDRQPTLVDLARATGMSRAAVIASLKRTEETRWIVRHRSSGLKTTYGLALGTSPQHGPVQEVDPSTEETGTSPPPGPTPSTRPLSSKEGENASEDALFEPPESTRKPARKRVRDESERADVDQVCRHLVECMVNAGEPAPTVAARWRTDARLLLDNDKRELPEVLAVITWSWMTGCWWRGKIDSVGYLRKKFGTLRNQRASELARMPTKSAAWQQPTDPNRFDGDLRGRRAG